MRSWKFILLVVILVSTLLYVANRQATISQKSNIDVKQVVSDELVITTDVWYGTPVKISQSGDFRFDRTDKDGLLIKDSHWFWVIPTGIGQTPDRDEVYEVLQKNPTGTYEITGSQDADECNYYEDGPLVGTCIQGLLLIDITLVK